MLLRLSGVSKSFGGVHALRRVSFDLRPGEVHALVGENGAGKSTLVKIITGAVQPDAGTLTIRGQTITDNEPGRARDLGIAAIYQQPALFPDLTVAENVALGLEPGGWWRRVHWRQRGGGGPPTPPPRRGGPRPGAPRPPPARAGPRAGARAPPPPGRPRPPPPA